eukprot:evm.model.scf_174.2 EVM.evm.TU.scf_174.2   scf_174:14495-25490(+)
MEGAGVRGGEPPSPQRRRGHTFVIGVAGGTASGKTTVCDRILQRLHDQCVVILPQDSFYRDLTEEELRNVQDYNFDAPDAFDVEAIVECIKALKAGKTVEVPDYNFTKHRRTNKTRRMEPADVIIIEGILVLHIDEIRELLNMKVFVDTDDDVRLARRIQRDISMRGRDIDSVIQQYTRFVKPAFDQYVAPSRRNADVIIPWQRGNNIVAIDLITEHIRTKLGMHDLRRIYSNLEVVPSNYQIRGMHTFIRDRDTNKHDFVFYADRLIRLVVEAGLGHLPFKEKAVVTPTKSIYIGVEFEKKLCGVSIIRSGESMENALRACCKGIKIGKILVHRPRPNDKARMSADGSCMEIAARSDYTLVYEKLPKDIAQRSVLLLDPILGTGNSASKCIQVLKEKGVQESRILFLTLIAAPEGIHRVFSGFPQLTIITSEIDERVDEHSRVIPGKWRRHGMGCSGSMWTLGAVAFSQCPSIAFSKRNEAPCTLRAMMDTKASISVNFWENCRC